MRESTQRKCLGGIPPRGRFASAVGIPPKNPLLWGTLYTFPCLKLSGACGLRRCFFYLCCRLCLGPICWVGAIDCASVGEVKNLVHCREAYLCPCNYIFGLLTFRLCRIEKTPQAFDEPAFKNASHIESVMHQQYPYCQPSRARRTAAAPNRVRHPTEALTGNASTPIPPPTQARCGPENEVSPIRRPH